MGKKIKNSLDLTKIDIIIPVPDTGLTFALGIQEIIDKPICEGYIKNRYIDRTFIMCSNSLIKQNINRKISGIERIFTNQNVLIVDDSIVRGNTSRHIIKIAREFNCKNIYFASCAPIIRNTNMYGIYIPTREELIANGKTESQIQKALNIDMLLYNDLEEITRMLHRLNPAISQLGVSMFVP